MTQTLERLLSNPDETLDTLCTNMRAGLTLHELCSNWQVPYIRIRDFIAADAHRTSEYEASIEARNQALVDRTITELSRIAFSDLRLAFDPTTNDLLPPSQWPEHLAHAIESVDIVERFERSPEPDEPPTRILTKKIKLHSKIKSLETLSKYLGLMTDKPLNDSLASIADAITQARQRVINSNKTRPAPGVRIDDPPQPQIVDETPQILPTDHDHITNITNDQHAAPPDPTPE